MYLLAVLAVPGALEHGRSDCSQPKAEVLERAQGWERLRGVMGSPGRSVWDARGEMKC